MEKQLVNSEELGNENRNQAYESWREYFEGNLKYFCIGGSFDKNRNIYYRP